jgi:hypothetical protein
LDNPKQVHYNFFMNFPLFQEFQKFFQNELPKKLPDTKFSEVYNYALYPTGKLFRPQLALAMAEDLKIKDESSLFNLASSLEVHHVYTLIHDDLPAMDDDDTRRGKDSTHIKFNEWKAILAGDGLQAFSYQLLATCPKAGDLIKAFSWFTGPKGLILGQAIDLDRKGDLDFNTLLQMHELKTARLIQASLYLPYLVSGETSFTNSKDMLRLGQSIGIAFQLFDDLTELTEELNPEEYKVNAFLIHPENALSYLGKLLKKQTHIMKRMKLGRLQEVNHYYQNLMIQKIRTNSETIQSNLKKFGIDSSPIFLFLDDIDKGQSIS